jgi:hypothetical protein
MNQKDRYAMIKKGLVIIKDLDKYYAEQELEKPKCACGKEISKKYKQCYKCFKNNPICQICDKPLVTIGNDRKNGKDQKDWSSRKYHKKCYKEGRPYHPIFFF